MNQVDFQTIFFQQMERCETVLLVKSEEYSSPEDKLHNFKVSGALQGITQDRALGGMLAKHIVSIFDLINRDKPSSMDLWDEKITDAINYLILLKAIVVEMDPNSYLRLVSSKPETD